MLYHPAMFQFDMRYSSSGFSPSLTLHPYMSNCGIAKYCLKWWANGIGESATEGYRIVGITGKQSPCCMRYNGTKLTKSSI